MAISENTVNGSINSSITDIQLKTDPPLDKKSGSTFSTNLERLNTLINQKPPNSNDVKVNPESMQSEALSIQKQKEVTAALNQLQSSMSEESAVSSDNKVTDIVECLKKLEHILRS